MDIDKLIYEKEIEKVFEICNKELFCQECTQSNVCCKYKALIKKHGLNLDEIHPENWSEEDRKFLVDFRLLKER